MTSTPTQAIKKQPLHGQKPNNCDLDSCAPPNDTPSVPTADELFGGKALEQLRCSQELAMTVEELRAREAAIAQQAEAATRGERFHVYAQLVAGILLEVGTVLPAVEYVDSTGLFEAVVSLPFASRTAIARRQAREVARVAMLSDGGGFHVPGNAEGIRGLWEQAMRGKLG